MLSHALDSPKPYASRHLERRVRANSDRTPSRAPLERLPRARNFGGCARLPARLRTTEAPLHIPCSRISRAVVLAWLEGCAGQKSFLRTKPECPIYATRFQNEPT